MGFWIFMLIMNMLIPLTMIGGCLEVGQIIPMIGSIVATECELKQVFDDKGKRKCK